MSLKFLSDCRFVVSPFLSLEETSWRILLRRYGAQLCYTPLVNASDIVKDSCLPERLFKAKTDRPLITQLFSKDSQTLLEAVLRVEGHCDAVDISCQDDTAALSSEEQWSSWLNLVKQVRSHTDAALVCKLPLEPSAVDDVLQKIRVVEDVGCQFVLLHGPYYGSTRRPSMLNLSHWDLIKTLREAASIPLIVDINCASLHNVNQFLEHTGVQGVAVAEPLEGNPAFFIQKKPPVLEVAREYVALCELSCTSSAEAKDYITRLVQVYLSAYPDGVQELMEAQDFNSIVLVLDKLEKEMGKLSNKRIKALAKLHSKKEKYRMKKAEKKLQSKETTGRESEGREEVEGAEVHVPKKELKRIQKERAKEALASGQRIALDLSLEENMNDKEISKLAGQLRRLYGSNMKSSSPFHVMFTSLDKSGKIYKESCRQTKGFENFMVDMSDKHFMELCPADDIVFLTPDSTNVLDRLDPDMVYIIGGLVDHQVLRNVTHTRAESNKTMTARLPIDEHMERAKAAGNFSYSKVLTVNQVFDILLKFHETGDWSRALLAGVPTRKGFVLKSRDNDPRQQVKETEDDKSDEEESAKRTEDTRLTI